MSIFIVRHGHTDWSDDRCQGSIDIELNEEGLQQARLISLRLNECGITEVYTSNLRRAFQTADTIAQYIKARLIVNPDLREICFGEWEGKTWREIHPRCGRNENEWFDSIINNQVPSGEPYIAFRNRVLKAFKEICKQSSNNCAIVTHAAVIKVLLTAFNPDIDTKRDISIYGGSISTIVYNTIDFLYKVLSVNDITHLKELNPPLLVESSNKSKALEAVSNHRHSITPTNPNPITK